MGVTNMTGDITELSARHRTWLYRAVEHFFLEQSEREKEGGSFGKLF